MMMDDANQWLMSGKYTEKPHDKTGAMALHIAAAKGYASVIKSVPLLGINYGPVFMLCFLIFTHNFGSLCRACLLYTSPSPRDS